MSLHNIAQHMQGAGRGQDSMLVHMTPGEVQGLQSLALAHGGSLTINPKTGLPEAGILSSLLPMIAGFALGPGGFQLMTAAQAGLAVGAVSTLATGSLSKGIMAGLGAYGGAGLGGGLNAVGSAAGAAGPTTSTLGSMASGATPNAVTKLIADAPIASSAFAPNVTTVSGLPTSMMPDAGKSLMFRNVVPPAPPPVAPPALPPVASAPLVRAGEVAAFQPRPMDMPTVKPVQSVMFGGGSAPSSGKLGYTPSDQLSAQQNPTLAGLKASTSNGLQGFKDLYSAMEKESPYSGMAAGYSLMNAMNEPPPSPTRKKSLIRPYNLRKDKVLDPNVGPGSSAERNYFDTEWTALKPYEAPGPEYAASGGMMGMAEGGYVDEALSHDAVSMDSGRPLPQQQPIYMGMQPQQPQQNIIAQPGNTMSTPGFAGGGNVPRYGFGGQLGILPELLSSDSSSSGGGSTLFYNTETGKVEPKPTVTAGAVSPTGQKLDAYGGYSTQYGQYVNAAGEGQMWYMNPAFANDPGAMKQRNAAQQAQMDALMKPATTTTTDTTTTPAAPVYANPTQIANAYSKVFGRTPDVEGLDYYSGQNLTPAEVEKSLRESEEYKKKLTTPLVAPISYTGNRLSYDDIKKQLGHDPTYAEVKTAGEAFVPNRATIEGAPAYQTPEQKLGLAPNKPRDQTPDFYAMMNKRLAEQGGYAGGGDINAYSLGGYSDGGRLLRGPGDGVSDDIPASIGDRQPARLADGEFVVPARIVSELGNGSTEAGAKRLYAMMDRVQRARTKTMGKGKVAVNSKADKYLPA